MTGNSALETCAEAAASQRRRGRSAGSASVPGGGPDQATPLWKRVTPAATKCQ